MPGAQEIRDAIIGAQLDGSPLVVLPRETYVITPDGLNSGDGAVIVPSGLTITAEPGTRIIQTGLGVPTNTSFQYHVFLCLDGTTDVTFSGLCFEGENTPFQKVFNHQSAAIDIRLNNSRDITVAGCTFRNLFGFSVHDRGSNLKTTVLGCDIRDCANGLNVNARHSQLTRNRLENSEGIECSGAHSRIERNDIIKAIGVGISVGGVTTAGASVPGVVVNANTIDESDGTGIVLADGLVGATISANTIRKTAKTGIVNSSNYNPVKRCSIVGNTLQSCGADGVGSVGVDLGSQGGHVVSSNVITDDAQSGYQTKTALIVRCQKTIIVGNVLSGTLKDLMVTASAVGSVIGPNVLINNTQDIQI